MRTRGCVLMVVGIAMAKIHQGRRDERTGEVTGGGGPHRWGAAMREET